MKALVNPGRRSPECGSKGYAFRARKNIAAEKEQPAVETEYRRKGCGRERQERLAVREAG